MFTIKLEQSGASVLDFRRLRRVDCIRHKMRIQHSFRIPPKVDEGSPMLHVITIRRSSSRDQESLRQIRAVRKVPTFGIVRRYNYVQSEIALDQRPSLRPRRTSANCYGQYQG